VNVEPTFDPAGPEMALVKLARELTFAVPEEFAQITAIKNELAAAIKSAAGHPALAHLAPLAARDPKAVELLIDTAAEIAATEHLRATVEHLRAAFDETPAIYELRRQAEARRLGLRVAALDSMVIGKNGKNPQAAGLQLDEPEPWPNEVAGAELLGEIVAALERYMSLPPHAAEALALWALFSFTIDAFDCAPRLALLSPVMRCGKTTLLRILSRIVLRPLLASNVSPAALFRVIEAAHPTLLVDEADSFARENEELRGILNSGHTRDAAFVVRCEGDDNSPRRFSTWAAVSIAAIGRIPATWLDRSIVINLKRKSRGDRVEKLSRAKLAAIGPLARKAARWAIDNHAALTAAVPAFPDALDDRAADNWSPLLTIADAVGGDWPARARNAALALSASRADAQNLSIDLLADIKAIVDGRDRITSSELCDALVALETRPWRELSRGRPLTTARLARMLGSFGVSPRKGHAANEYHTDDFADAFERYLALIDASSPSQSSEVPQAPRAVSENEFSKFRTEKDSGTLKSSASPTQSEGCGTSELSTPQNGDQEDF